MTIAKKTEIQQLLDVLEQINADAWIQPTQDNFLSEYPPESAKRLSWLTGFDGSAGAALVIKEPVSGKQAALFTDSRYTLQASKQLDDSLFHVVNIADDSPVSWLAKHQPNAVLSFDPCIHSHKQVAGWGAINAKPVENIVDTIWEDRPAEPCNPIIEHPMKYSGESSGSKIQRVIESLSPEADAVFLSLPDGINWLLNIRGSDISFNPLVLCYALLTRAGEVTLITHQRDLPKCLSGVKLLPLDEFTSNRSELFEPFDAVQMDESATVEAVWQAANIAGCKVIEASDPTLLPKAIKNDIEIEGMRESHRRDGRALSKFLQWVDKQDSFDELQAVQRLQQFRKSESADLYRGESFDTISGTGANGAIVHYRVTPDSNRSIQSGELYLVDSGGQYPDGTTDVTRTIVKGEPSAEMIDRFTRVLKGHIAVSSAVFPKGTSGSQIDSLARQYLWEIGEDYAHGTGHGVGSHLCVHEGPQRISKRGGDVSLQAGMIVSNEPGYYKNGEYGIRIESLVLVKESPLDGFLCFEDLTLAPIDERLIDRAMLTPKEVEWLSDYHQRVADNNNA